MNFPIPILREMDEESIRQREELVEQIHALQRNEDVK